MRRKFVAAVLVLAMIMGMSTIAMAEEQKNNTGEAGIAYKEGKITIIDPKDPDIPGGDDWNFATSRDIDFGEHDVVQNVVEQRYASWMENRGDDTDYVGIIIRNGTLAKLSVSVEIDKFFIDPEDANIATLEGFELNLVKNGYMEKNKGAITNPYNKEITEPVKAVSNSSNKDFDKNADHLEKIISVGNTATILNLPGLGVHAATWGGILTVPQNTVTDLGDAQAVMTWNINNTSVDDDNP